MKFTELRERCIAVVADRQRECWPAAKQTQEDQLMIVDEVVDLMALEQYRRQGIAADQALVAPYRDEAAVVTENGAGQPIRVFAPLTGSVDESACKHVVVFHNIRGQFTELSSKKNTSGTAETVCSRTSPPLRFDFTRGAGLVVERIGILNIAGVAGRTNCKVELIVIGNVQQ